MGKGIAGTVGMTGESINIPDAYKDARFNQEVKKKLFIDIIYMYIILYTYIYILLYTYIYMYIILYTYIYIIYI